MNITQPYSSLNKNRPAENWENIFSYMLKQDFCLSFKKRPRKKWDDPLHFARQRHISGWVYGLSQAFDDRLVSTLQLKCEITAVLLITLLELWFSFRGKKLLRIPFVDIFFFLCLLAVALLAICLEVCMLGEFQNKRLVLKMIDVWCFHFAMESIELM